MSMNVYQLNPIGEACGGMALVAAPDFETAKDEYILNGEYGQEVALGAPISRFSDIPIAGLHYEGGVQILCDKFYFE